MKTCDEDVLTENTPIEYDNANVYDENEKVIGSFFGKPLYRRCLLVKSGKENVITYHYFISPFKIDKMIKFQWLINRGGACDSSTYGSQSNDYIQLFCHYTNQYISIKHNYSFFANKEFIVIMDYTKTTD